MLGIDRIDRLLRRSNRLVILWDRQVETYYGEILNQYGDLIITAKGQSTAEVIGRLELEAAKEIER